MVPEPKIQCMLKPASLQFHDICAKSRPVTEANGGQPPAACSWRHVLAKNADSARSCLVDDAAFASSWSFFPRVFSVLGFKT